MVKSHLLSDRPADVLFHRAWSDGLSALPPDERRGALATATGHIAESVAETLLERAGFTPLWHFIAGGQGVDLLMVDPEMERVLAVEVKGTLRPNYWPRLSHRGIAQMTPAWLDRHGNAGMDDWGLTSSDVYGAVVLLNFADMEFKAAETSDFRSLSELLL
jgi:hypothetical protein